MIEVKNLVKKYGNHMAIDHLNFKIEKGQVYGFLGPNGAGKSTTMNIMTGYLGATEGEVLIDGHDILKEPKEAKKHIGYLPGPNGSFIQEHKKSPCSKSLYLFCKGNCFLTSKEFCHLFESALSALHTARLLLLSLQFQVLNLRDTIHSFQSLTIFYSCNNYNNLHAFYRF